MNSDRISQRENGLSLSIGNYSILCSFSISILRVGRLGWSSAACANAAFTSSTSSAVASSHWIVVVTLWSEVLATFSKPIRLPKPGWMFISFRNRTGTENTRDSRLGIMMECAMLGSLLQPCRSNRTNEEGARKNLNFRKQRCRSPIAFLMLTSLVWSEFSLR